VPALVGLLGCEGAGGDARGHAAEALVQLAAVDSHRKRLIVRCVLLLFWCCAVCTRSHAAPVGPPVHGMVHLRWQHC
jgi:hypothetical protein